MLQFLSSWWNMAQILSGTVEESYSCNLETIILLLCILQKKILWQQKYWSSFLLFTLLFPFSSYLYRFPSNDSV